MASVRGSKKKPKSRGNPKPWEPSARDLELYAEIVRGKNYAELAEPFGVSAVRVRAISKQVDEWLKPQYMDEIRSLRVRQSQSLMHVFREAMDAWERSKRPAASRTTKDGKEGTERSRTVKGQSGNPAFLAEARAALADIRKIWGADAPQQSEHTHEIRVAGLSRDDAIREQIDRMEAAMRPSDN